MINFSIKSATDSYYDEEEDHSKQSVRLLTGREEMWR